VTPQWITDEELTARPAVKTMSVRPPMGPAACGCWPSRHRPAGLRRHARARTSEIGRVECIKIETKGKMNRRFVIALT